LPPTEGAGILLDRGGERPIEGGSPGDMVLVRIPREYAAVREHDHELAMEWREATALALDACFAAGLTAMRFLRDSTYVFEKE